MDGFTIREYGHEVPEDSWGSGLLFLEAEESKRRIVPDSSKLIEAITENTRIDGLMAIGETRKLASGYTLARLKDSMFGSKYVVSGNYGDNEFKTTLTLCNAGHYSNSKRVKEE